MTEDPSTPEDAERSSAAEVLDYARVPSWVAWLAQDADGAWWGFEHEPNRHDSGWYENEVGRSVLLVRNPPNSRWRNTLMPRPRITYDP